MSVSNLNNLINQSGLSANYVSGVTDFDVFVATTTGFNGSSGVGGVDAGPPADFDFTFSQTIKTDRIALWNQGGIASLVSFTLFGSLAGDFSYEIEIGTFTNSNFNNSLANVFTFTEVDITAIRVRATSNQGFMFGTRFDEFAIGGTLTNPATTPEPTTFLGLLLVGGFGLLSKQQKHN
ncbi:PEP-CTERM sorting domain-containing protein [Crocosphaera sp. Alani8]|uniref:PEP-CTERM sorting domain-containing protein n=1 Tax=Crocosphaera sp. Alani8 TaxID=3038952 RepID=UPI00313BC185